LREIIKESMKSDVKLSVVLATYNEAENIERCLAAVADIADEIIVVDGESKDNTREIAKKMGARVTKTSNKPIFHINKQMAIDAATGDWVLQLDADEVVDGEMKEAITEILLNGSQFDAFWLKRKNYFLGTFLTKGGQYPDPVIRLFKKGKAHLPQKDVHEQMVVTGEIGWLDGHLLHYNAPTFKRYITNANRYTSLTAANMKQAGIRLSLSNDINYLIVKPKLSFLRLYFRHRGYRDGFPGFVFALFSGLHHALSYMKLRDLYRNENSH
jgi:glycosyltransferase involved in cell wall biosynthesis